MRTFGHPAATCWVLGSNLTISVQTRANNTQHVATHRNTVAKRPQHAAPNNVAICCIGMLRSFGRGFKFQFLGPDHSKFISSHLHPLTLKKTEPELAIIFFSNILTVCHGYMPLLCVVQWNHVNPVTNGHKNLAVVTR